MGLTKYNKKRNLDKTAEPKGKTKRSKTDLIFVVQKHAASRLHYDFRLELDGVLKSWAIPKGPSMNPEDKRLAVMVEDHPYDYKDFEGNIPEGNYGAGNVLVWDNGTYTAIEATDNEDGKKRLNAGLLKGHLAIRLNGKKLKGGFDLVQLKGKQENAWLLIKKKDDAASESDILKKNKSVLSGSTLESLGKKSAKEKAVKNKKPATGIAPEAGNDTTPGFVAPMLADTTLKPFDKEDWIFEIKYDGYRTISVINMDAVDLYSRNHLSFNAKFKTIADELQKIKHTAVLDGEVVVEDAQGRSDFRLLQNYQKTGEGVLKYYVFDILNLDGNVTTDLSLLERKELLRMLLARYPLRNVIYSEHILRKGNAFFASALKANLEGIMAKHATSPYWPGRRSGEWLKIKLMQQEEAVIIGITEPKGARNYFGALLLARYRGKELIYAGNCGTGFNEETLKDLYSRFESSFINASPLSEKVKLPGKIQWIKPRFVAQVKFTEITKEGRFRHPVFLGLRTDKKAKNVTLQSHIKPAPPPDDHIGDDLKQEKMEKPSKDLDLKIGKAIVHVTHPDKVYFPEDGITKGDVVNYYRKVAEFMLPYLKGRPQSMNRFPGGIHGQSFYHKDVDVENIPSWLKTVKIYSESNHKDIDYLLCNDEATLVYMANLGCIEINPWNSMVNHIENPDWVVIDLDPEKDDFKEVVKTALEVKNVLDELDVKCYCKTSGATGLHIYIPLAAKYPYDTVKIFAELVAHNVNARLPDITTITRSLQKRDHKIYIDFLQNRRGQTLAAPYSIRPRPGATVSTPLEWKEVNEKLSPSQFTVKNILKRLDKKGDLWKPVLGKGINLDKILKKLSIKATWNSP